MPDTLTTITKLIQSPPGQLAAGGVLAGIVWKFFERVEAVLKDDTKLEIAVWLLDIQVTATLEDWPTTFRKVFNRVFGVGHWTWLCLGRSSVATLAIMVVCSLRSFVNVISMLKSGHVHVGSNALALLKIAPPASILQIGLFIIVSAIIPDYVSMF